MTISEIKTDLSLEEEGIWIEFGEGAKCKIRSANSKAYKKAIRKAQARIPAHRLKRPDVAEKSVEEAMEAVLVEWEGFTDGAKGKEKAIDVTAENRKKLLAIPALRNWIAEQAQDLANFQNEKEAADSAGLKSGS